MRLITDLVIGLLASEFRIVGGMYDSKVISDDTRYIALYKQVGTIMYAVGIINCDKEYDYRAKQKEISEFFMGYYERLNVKSILLTSLLLTDSADEEIKEFADMQVFDVENSFIEARWIVERGTKNVIIEGDQPKEVLDIKKILNRALDKDGQFATAISVEELIKNDNEKRLKDIKSKNCFLTYSILLINVIILIIMEVCGGSQSSEVLMAFGALYPQSVIEQGEYYRMFTSMFLHIGYYHLLANSLSLLIFGMRCERFYGKIKMAIIYLVSGLCSAVAVVFFENAITAGASGAILGLIGAILVYVAMNRRSVDGLDIYIIIMFAVISIGTGFIISGVSNAGHIGGFIGGVITGFIMNKTGSKDKA